MTCRERNVTRFSSVTLRISVKKSHIEKFSHISYSFHDAEALNRRSYIPL